MDKTKYYNIKKIEMYRNKCENLKSQQQQW